MSAHAIDWRQVVHNGVRPIHSDEELSIRTEEHMALAFMESRSADEDDALAMLTMLITTYENTRVSIPDVEPIEVVRFLMEHNDLKQRDLASEFGSETAVSLFLNGKRELTKQQIERLSQRFLVDPSAFFPPVGRVRRVRKSGPGKLQLAIKPSRN